MNAVGVPFLAALLFLPLGPLSADETTIAFDSLQRSEIVKTRFLSFCGIVLGAIKAGHGLDLAMSAGVWPRNPRQSMRAPACSIGRAATREQERRGEAWSRLGG